MSKNGTLCERQACEIRLRAGQLIRVMEKAKGAQGNPDGWGVKIVQSCDTTAQTTLAEIGISKDQSSKWQKLADTLTKSLSKP
jgi:hypothetical protein